MKKICIAIAFLTLAACANTATMPRPVAHYAYTKYPPIVLNVASIQVVDYTPSMRAPNVEHLMPQSLPDAVSQWAHNRFRTNGTDGTLVITIKDASMIGKDLQKSDGVKGFFTIDQAERFDAHIAVDFSASNLAMGGSGNGSVQVNRGTSIAEDASMQDRDRVWTKIEEDMITDLDAATLTMLQNRLPALIQK